MVDKENERPLHDRLYHLVLILSLIVALLSTETILDGSETLLEAMHPTHPLHLVRHHIAA